jgi:hypothetical protein
VKAVWVVVLLLGCGPAPIDAVGLAPSTLGSGLVAHWTFDETDGSVLADDSGNRRDGIVSGATFRSDGRFGGALHFVPGDSVTVEQSPYATASWTFSAWIRIGEEDVVATDFGSAINTEVLGEGGWQLQTRDRASGIYWSFAYWAGSGRTGYGSYECRCFELGRWSHATVVIDAAQNLLSFYVDGKLAGSTTSPGPILPGTSDLFMGKFMGEGRLFSGSLDDVAIYDRALLAAEVAELDLRPPPRPR